MKFNLSDKERTYRGSKVIDSFNVKEFIKLLKEEKDTMPHYKDGEAVLQHMDRVIDKLAGDKLT